MVYKFTAIKTVTDPIERKRRLDAVYGRFERNTALGDILADEPNAATEATTQATRPGKSSTLRRAGQTQEGVR